MNHLFNAMKPLLSDLASTIFFAGLFWLTDNIYLSTGVGVAIGVGQVLVEKLRGRPVSVMQWMSLLLVVVFGGLTLWLHDPRFVIAKFTIGKLAIGIAMLTPNWMSRYLPRIVTDTLSAAELTFYSALWPVTMFALAAGNLYVGFVLGTEAWKWFIAIAPAAATWGLFALQYLVIRLRTKAVLRRRAPMLAAAE